MNRREGTTHSTTALALVAASVPKQPNPHIRALAVKSEVPCASFILSFFVEVCLSLRKAQLKTK
jgi:hypothetical protein